MFNKAKFIEKAKQVHGDKYDYSKVNYIDSHTKVCIICPIHGEFWQTPNKHLMGRGCKLCGYKSMSNKKISSTEKFIEKCKKIYGDTYDYSKVEYVDSQTKVCIICKKHGEFECTPNNHLRGRGCPKCGNIKNKIGRTKKVDQFIKEAKLIHGDKYDYSKVEYINSHTKVCIICKEHGEFWQTPHNHLCGNGCPKCNQSKLENEIMSFLKEKHIEYIPQHSFEWLKNKNSLHLDFYLPKYNIAIECQGIQHFIQKDYFGGEEGFNYIFENDLKKKKMCDDNNVKLFYYSNLGIIYPYKVYENINEMFKEIINKK